MQNTSLVNRDSFVCGAEHKWAPPVMWGTCPVAVKHQGHPPLEVGVFPAFGLGPEASSSPTPITRQSDQSVMEVHCHMAVVSCQGSEGSRRASQGVCDDFLPGGGKGLQAR